MTRTIYWTATSLDGFIADADNSLDWLFDVPRGPNHPDRFTGFFEHVGAVVMGSTTWEWVLEQEGMRAEPEKWDQAFDGRPTWVFTSRDLEPLPGERGIRFVSGDVRPVHDEAVAAADGGDIWLVGGGDLVGQFDDHGLLEAIEVDIQPVLLGAGSPLLPRRITSERLALDSLERIGEELHARYSVAPPGVTHGATGAGATARDEAGEDPTGTKPTRTKPTGTNATGDTR